MSKKEQIIAELLDGLDTLRPVVLQTNEKNTALRSLLRRMVSLLDVLQITPSIEPERHQKTIKMLTHLMDAEHGTLLKHLPEHKTNDEIWGKLEQHIQNRKKLIDTAQQDLPFALTIVRRGCDLLGKAYPETDDLGKNLTAFEKYLREHLQNNAKVRVGFNSLTSAFKGSVAAMNSVLSEVGDASPELKHVQKVLEQKLPEDPEKAQALLKQSTQDILKAGEKLNLASKKIKETFSNQIQEMNNLSQRLQQAEEQARNDPLTGLANRRKLREYFNDLSDSEPSTFMMIDIDHFKHINDKYGHDFGDVVLVKLAELLRDAVCDTDMVARLGGEEFCIVLAKVTGKQGLKLAEKLRQTVVNTSFNGNHKSIGVHISIGVAERLNSEAINLWLKRADSALYYAKNNGRNQVASASH